MKPEIVRIGPEHLAMLIELFDRIAVDPEARHFHPHPFTPLQAEIRAVYLGPDIYSLMVLRGRATGYGFLRGWEEGYAIPSLGIYIAKERRGTGDARRLMNHLHEVARLRGASHVRLKVHPDNIRAKRLYERIGYQFHSALDRGQCVGLLDLRSGRSIEFVHGRAGPKSYPG
ncbi:MAG: GNAT family N-acetyltransferase [Bryobacteraceae bacterium]|nr:GNAT family N-acetyltransferase [Bryobacteraceae bacterium]